MRILWMMTRSSSCKTEADATSANENDGRPRGRDDRRVSVTSDDTQIQKKNHRSRIPYPACAGRQYKSTAIFPAALMAMRSAVDRSPLGDACRPGVMNSDANQHREVTCRRDRTSVGLRTGLSYCTSRNRPSPHNVRLLAAYHPRHPHPLHYTWNCKVPRISGSNHIRMYPDSMSPCQNLEGRRISESA